MFILPKVQTAGDKLAEGLGQSIGNIPSLLLGLRKEKREGEAQFGNAAVELAEKSGRDISLEEKGRIFKEGAKLYKRNMSPSEIQEALIGKTIKAEDQRSRMEENAVPENAWEKTKGFFKGESSEDRSLKRQKLHKQLEKSPLSSREKFKFLTDKGLGIEEASHIANPLSKGAVESINTFPDLKTTRPRKTGILGEEGELDMTPLTEPQREFFKKHLAEVFQKDPNANPLLVRRDFEKKGVSWREYRDAIDELQQEGVIDFSGNEDYAQLEKYINKPPLGPLDKILHGMKLIGR